VSKKSRRDFRLSGSKFDRSRNFIPRWSLWLVGFRFDYWIERKTDGWLREGLVDIDKKSGRRIV
jgi:hypothetical protein